MTPVCSRLRTPREHFPELHRSLGDSLPHPFAGDKSLFSGSGI